MRYLTPQQYRYAYEGLVEPATTSITDLMLARMIEESETALDGYLGFHLEYGGFDPHVVFAAHGFDADNRKFSFPTFPVPVRNVQRYRIHISNASPAGTGLFAIINNGDAVLNQGQGYIEIVPLQAISFTLAPILMQLGLNPSISEVDAEVGFFNAFFGDTLYNDSGDNKTFRALRGFWAGTYTQAISNQPNTLPPIPPVVYNNGVVQSASNYTINYQEGVVAFTSVVSGPVTADYTATIPDLIKQATICQTTYMLQQRRLNLIGAGGLEQVREGNVQIRRAKTDDAQEDQLCAKARTKLAGYKPIAAG